MEDLELSFSLEEFWMKLGDLDFILHNRGCSYHHHHHNHFCHQYNQLIMWLMKHTSLSLSLVSAACWIDQINEVIKICGHPLVSTKVVFWRIFTQKVLSVGFIIIGKGYKETHWVSSEWELCKNWTATHTYVIIELLFWFVRVAWLACTVNTWENINRGCPSSAV